MEYIALESLAGFCNRISDPNFAAGEWISPEGDNDEVIAMPYVQFTTAARDFIAAADASKWLNPDFDWSEWVTSDEAARLFNDPHTLTTAEPSELSKILTVCIRRDKFTEGALLDDFKNGLILRIVQRAAAIIEKTDTATPPSKKLSSQQAGALGELLALAKLNSLGVAAYMSPEGAPGHDLIAIIDGKAKSIEVKTRQFFLKPSEITRWPVNLETKGDADFFLFVELDLKTISPAFYLLTNQQARATNKSAGAGQGNCYPAQVRLCAKRNDFSALLGT
ncbi:DUF6508 domain-containing protein [Cypionkella sp. TWP1-2-1b2]|uniref:DUF6508 domain-containing protein n=1 Tax=Cypionkella sp. TWP1-2-1b2 TaxID=2804675 RepID=UPI003CE94733